MNTNQLRQPKNRIHTSFIRACAGILLLRALITTLLPDNFIYIKDQFADMLISGLILVLFLIFSVKKYADKANPFRSHFNLPIWLLLLACWVSLIRSADFSQSLYCVIPMTSYVLFFYILKDSLKTQGSLRTFWPYAIACIVAVIIFALWEYFVLKNPDLPPPTTIFGPFVYKRVGSVFQLPNALAGFLMLSIPLIWASILLTSKQWLRRLLTLLLILTLVTYLMSFSFLCTVNFIISILFLTPLLLKDWFKRNLNKKAFALLALSILTFLLLIIWIRPDLSLTARWEYLKTAFALLQNNPWTGSGLATFDIVNRKFVSYVLGYSAYVHNSYLQLWVETGLLGLMAGILLIVSFIKAARRALEKISKPQERILLVALIWSIGAFLLDNMTNFTLLRHSVSLFFWSALAGFCAFTEDNDTTVSQPKNYHGVMTLFLVGILTLLLVTTTLSMSLLNYRQGMRSLMQNDLKGARDYFKKAEKYNPADYHCASGSGFVSIRQYFLSRSSQDLDDASRHFQRATRLSPHSDRSYEILSSIALERGDKTAAEAYHLQAASLSPFAYRFKERAKTSNTTTNTK